MGWDEMHPIHVDFRAAPRVWSFTVEQVLGLGLGARLGWAELELLGL